MKQEIQRLTVAKAPLRISMAGGGTDLPSYSDNQPGLVISCAIDRYVSVVAYPRQFRGDVRTIVDSVSHARSASDVDDPFTRAILQRVGITSNVQLVSLSDVPPRTGLGGSGAFTVAALNALRLSDAPSARALAEEASAIEIEDLGRPVGKHDHYMAAFGGIRVLRFHDGEVEMTRLSLSPAIVSKLEQRLLLFCTGISRDAGQVLAAQDLRTRSGDRTVIAALDGIREVADEMMPAIEAGDIDLVGSLLDSHWNLKRQMSDGVSTPTIDELYRQGLEAGCSGGKLLGAGGGGFLLFVTRRGRESQVRRAMNSSGLYELDFGLTSVGSVATHLDL